MKFTVECRQSSEEHVTVSVIKDAGSPNDTVLGTVECHLDFVNGKIVLHMTSHRSEVDPILEFEYGKVSEVHRRRHTPDA